MNNAENSIEKVYREMLMKLSGKKRLLMSLSMSRLSLEIMVCGIMEKYGDRDLKKHVFLRLYGNDFTDKEKEKILASIK
jgi:hypothetical protein